MAKIYREDYKEFEKATAQLIDKHFNGEAMCYTDNAEYFTKFAHRYTQNEFFKFMMAMMKAMANGNFDGRNRYAHSMSKKIIEFLDENKFVYANNDEHCDELIPYDELMYITTL